MDMVTLTPIEEDGYSNATYEVKTICPLVGKPLMITYHYTQDDLDEYIQRVRELRRVHRLSRQGHGISKDTEGTRILSNVPGRLKCDSYRGHWISRNLTHVGSNWQ